MASSYQTSVLFPNKPDDDENLPGLRVDLGSEIPTAKVQDGATVTELPDGSVAVDLSPKSSPQYPDPLDDRFNANLAEQMDEGELNKIASEILEGIDRDEQGRVEHLEMLAEGIKILGLTIETLTTTSVTSSAPLEGMSTVRHPLLLEACVLFQANAVGELLPAAGPVKVRDDRPREPDSMKQKDRLQKAISKLMGHNGGPPMDSVSPFNNPQSQNNPSPPVHPMSGGASAPGGGFPPPPAATGGHPMSPPGVPAPPTLGVGSPGAPNGPTPPSPGGTPTAAAAGLGPSPGGGPSPTAPGTAAPQGQPAPAPAPIAEDEEEERDAVEEALEKDMNHYLMEVDKGYYADTDQMLFKVGFGGVAVKKIYHDPLTRRPMSRSINLEDFIVAKDVSDLCDADRVTHRIRMNKSKMRRMQIVGAYRDIEIGEPTMAADAPNQVKQTKEEVMGIRAPTDPRDLDYEVFECYCLLDIDRFAPRQFKGKRLPLPFKVSVERYTQKVLEIRRNWRKDDDECMAKQWFVDFPYMRAFGFYCIGLLHLLGNTDKALTALWREFIDAGMFANFPGFLYVKGAGRQLTNQFRVAPGSGIALDSEVDDIRQAVMPLPYKSPDAAFAQFVEHVEQIGERLGGTANTPVPEGRADAPVGTTLALIEQASKPVGAVNKRLHAAQAREFDLLKERFREDPEAFWRFNKKPAMKWEKDLFLKALEDFSLSPVSDPNNPTKLHRMAKAEAYRQVVTGAPQAFDPKKAILKYCTEIGIDGVEETLSPNIGQMSQPQQPPVDQGKMAQVMQQHAKAQMDAQNAQNQMKLDMLKQHGEFQDNAAERQNKLQIASVNQDTERLRLASTVAIHASDLDAAQQAANMQIASDHAGQAHEHMNRLEVAQQQGQQRLAEGGAVAVRQEQAARSDFSRQQVSDAAQFGRDQHAAGTEHARSRQLAGDEFARQQHSDAVQFARDRQSGREEFAQQQQADTTAHSREMEKAAREHSWQAMDDQVAHARQSEDAEVAHERAKDMATHNAKVAPKPAAGAKKPAAKPKKGK